jgi:hypothetical protein
VVAGVRDEPVVTVDEIEAVAIAELHPRGEHVGVHPLDPCDELVQLGGAGRLPDPVDVDPGHHLLGRRLLAAAGEHVDLGVAVDQALGELADVPGEPALDQRRVLPGEDQYAHDGLSPLRLQERRQADVGGEIAHARLGGLGGVYGL